MRIHLELTANTEPVPFDYQVSLAGTFHKWLGLNDIHNEMSLYSFSWLKGGKQRGNSLNFQNGAHWFISSYDDSVIKTLIKGIIEQPEINFGMSVKEVSIQNTPDFASEHKFLLASPVLIKRFNGEKETHFTFKDDESDKFMTETLQAKLNKAGLEHERIEVKFDKSYSNPSTKLVDYRGIKNRANMCPVILKGSPAAIAFAWNVGIGNSTGIGFGSLM